MKCCLWLRYAIATLLAVGGFACGQAGKGSEPLTEDAWDYRKAKHLLARAGFGGAPDEVARLHAMGLHRAVDFLVDFRNLPTADFPLAIEPTQQAPQPKPDAKSLTGLTPQQRNALIQEQDKQKALQRKDERQQFNDLRQWWMKRMVETPRPLEEKLTLFWHGHFATGYQTVKDSYAMYQQNQLFRQHAENFGQLLQGIVRDAAMLRYLDNDKNVKTNPNENLGREILELFSMGEGNYSEQDIKEAARALTGYAFDRRSADFLFRRQSHDSGLKTIFGQLGNWDGDELVGLILAEPATARFIAGKLFVFFVHESPSAQTIEQLAQVLRENDYELSPLLKTMFLSHEFYSPQAMGTQIKCPVQLVVGAVRSLGIRELNYAALVTATQSMGQELLEPPNVKGWDGGSAWINTNTVFARHNFAAPLIAQTAARSKKPLRSQASSNPVTQRIDLAGQLAKKLPDTAVATDVVDYMVQALFAVPLDAVKREELIRFLSDEQPILRVAQWSQDRDRVNAKLQALLVLMMSMPEYQLT